MIFEESNSNFLAKKLCISVIEFEADLVNRFGSNAQCFNTLLSFLLQEEAINKLPDLDVMNQRILREDLKNKAFNYLKASYVVNDELEEYLYEIICYLFRYFCGGLIELFKQRQAENQGPRIYLKQRIVNDEKIDANLQPLVTVFRGMSISESKSGKFGMSWTLSQKKAEDFAFTTYLDEPRGVVVSTTIERENILYFDPTDSEKEVVLKNNSLLQVNVVAT